MNRFKIARGHRILLVAAVTASIVTVSCVKWLRRVPNLRDALVVAALPRIRPDYAGVTVPANIAPLNFLIDEEGDRFFTELSSSVGDSIKIASNSPDVVIPQEPWRRLLATNRGEKLRINVFVEKSGQWHKYAAITNRIAEEDIDAYLAYRLIEPVHQMWRDVTIQQRELATYQESNVLDGMSLEKGCINCHSFANNDPNRMSIGMRSRKYGVATLVADRGAAKKVGTKFGYTAWHPSGRLAVYSMNKSWQFFHTAGAEVRDVIDMDSALAYYVVENESVAKVPAASDKLRLETYPTWSPDGRWLYFCSAPMLWPAKDAELPTRYKEVRYDLMRVSYDLTTGQWGDPETVLSAEETGMSILLPRISPDGRFLLFCMCRYGCFPIYQPSSDLYMMDLSAGEYRRLEINSEFSESWHSWSSNSRWIAFSSKRQGGLFTRCFLSFVDENGVAHKPFMLPQKDARFYDSFLKTVSVPELINGPVPISAKTLSRVARSDQAITVDGITGASKPAGASEPWQPTRE
ncbi:MAG: PD40 domain-containing protein [Planctomycetes bacterium]|nr:PD40 domain-containing protein [Planctomycetota bacterium]MBL7039417.1 PD40 domain-containing protein [Pirellulaceae bacterium]